MIGEVVVFGGQQSLDEMRGMSAKRMGERRISPNSAISFPSLLYTRKGICNWMLLRASTEGRLGLRYRNAPLRPSTTAQMTATKDHQKNFSRRIKALGCPV